MFGSRTTFGAVAALSLGALGVAAQTALQRCGTTLKLVDAQPVYNWAVDDPAYYNVSYSYDPTLCTSTIPVNYVRLSDYETGASYSCTREQFAATRNTIHSQCVLTQ